MTCFSRLLPLLFLFACGCTYNPVCYDPITGFQSGGGVGVMCGGPLDPLMLECGQNGCKKECCLVRTLRKCNSCLLTNCCCKPQMACPQPCPPMPAACPTPCTPVTLPAACPTPCPQPVGAFSPVPQMMPTTQLPPVTNFAAPMAAPITPNPTFSQPCQSCGPNAATGMISGPQSVDGSFPTMTNYPQLFQGVPGAPPVMQADPFQMPVPYGEAPTAGPLPPNYNVMDPPAAQPHTHPAAMPPMNTAPTQPRPMTKPMPTPMANPMPQPTPAQKPMPMPMSTDANQTYYPVRHPSLMPAGGVPQLMPAPGGFPATGVQPAGAIQDSRHQQIVPVRL